MTGSGILGNHGRLITRHLHAHNRTHDSLARARTPPVLAPLPQRRRRTSSGWPWTTSGQSCGRPAAPSASAGVDCWPRLGRPPPDPTGTSTERRIGPCQKAGFFREIFTFGGSGITFGLLISLFPLPTQQCTRRYVAGTRVYVPSCTTSTQPCLPTFLFSHRYNPVVLHLTRQSARCLGQMCLIPAAFY